MSGHTFAIEGNAIVVREPAEHDACRVCTLAGDPHHYATHMQAAAICEALDKLAEEQHANGN